MKITEVAVDRRITVYVILFILIVMGVYSYVTITRESEPEIVIPFVIVTVPYEGVSPQDMETLVTIPLEKKISAISGVKEMRSTSSEGVSTVMVEFETGVDIDEALQRVRDKVNLAQSDLPEDADDPEIRDVNFAESPIIFANLTGPVSLAELTDLAEDLEDRLETISGVMEVDILGKAEREIQIVVDPIRAGSYGVSMADLLQLARTENVNTPAGSMDIGEAKYLMRVPGEFGSVDEIQNLVVKNNEDGVVYLRDLAYIVDGYKDAQSYARLSENPSVTLVIKKRAGVNIIKVSEEVLARLDEYKPRLPAGVEVAVTLDESRRIADMIRELEDSIYTGLILVLIVVLLFLGLANAFFVAMAIPLSLLITFIFMRATGLTLNMVTLFALMVSLGMLVDNGIVVVENIYRYAQEGKSRIQAAKLGTAEVAWPVFGSTLTTVAAFFPLVFWPGMMGRFMSLLPKTVIITLFASLFIGLIVNPALAAAFLNTTRAKKSGATYNRHPILATYEFLLRKAIRWRLVTVTLAAMTMITIVGIYMHDPHFVFLNEIEPDRAYVNIELPGGSNLDRTDEVARQIEAIVREETGNLDFMLANVGSKGAAVRESSPTDGLVTSYKSNEGRVTMVFPTPDRWRDLPSDVTARVRARLDDVLGAELRMSESSMGPGAGLPVNIEMSGEDFDELTRLAEAAQDEIRDVPGLVDLKDDLERGKPEVKIVVDRQKAALAGLNTQSIGLVVQTAVNGRKAGEYREGYEEYDVTVKFPEIFQRDLSNVESMSITNASGHQIPFSSVARVQRSVGFGSITRVDQKRTVTIQADADGRLGTEVLSDVQAKLADFPLPQGYTIRYTGENEETEEASAFMGQAGVVAMCLIALVLITQFNSIVQPVIIMTTVVLSLAGVFLGLLVFDSPFVVLMTGIGVIILAGVVVNNGIVLVDFINQLRREGAGLEAAIVTAGRTRFRPVMLTAITTIMGLTPLGLGIRFDFREFAFVTGGSQSGYWGSMAIAIIFGLSFATILTLFVVPTLYSISVDIRRAFGTSITPTKPVPALEPEAFPK